VVQSPVVMSMAPGRLHVQFSGPPSCMPVVTSKVLCQYYRVVFVPAELISLQR
jgi:hypothetical protein